MSTRKRQHLSPVSMIEKYMREGDGAESARLLTTLNNRIAPGQASPFVSPASEMVSGSANQTDGRTLDQTDIQTVAQTVSQPVGRSDGWSDGQTVGQSAVKPDVQTVIHPLNQPLNQPVGQSDGRSDVQTVIRTVAHPVGQTVQLTTPFNTNQLHFNDPARALTKNQCRVLLFLMSQPGITQRTTISEQTGVAFGTVKDALAVLVAKGFIGKPQYFVQGDYRGLSYMINRSLCEDFIRKRGAEFQTVDQTVIQTVNHPVSQPVSQSDGQTVPFSSSRIELKPTTTETPGSDDLLRDPELAYWREKGVNNRQINTWVEEFQMPIDQVIQSLKYCRYELVVLGAEEEKQISNAMNWFYKVMQRSGLYPKPNSYRSLAEIRAEQMEQAAKEAAEARDRQAAAERELAFQKIMSDPDSTEYQRLLAGVNEFAKEMGGKALEAALREVFEQPMDSPPLL